MNTFEYSIYSKLKCRNFYIQFKQIFANVFKSDPDLRIYTTWVFIMNAHTSRFIGFIATCQFQFTETPKMMYSCHINQSFDRTDNSASRFLFHIYKSITYFSNRVIFYLTFVEKAWSKSLASQNRSPRECLNAKRGQARTRAASFFYYVPSPYTSYIEETNSRLVVLCVPRTHSSLTETEKTTSLD